MLATFHSELKKEHAKKKSASSGQRNMTKMKSHFFYHPRRFGHNKRKFTEEESVTIRKQAKTFIVE